MFDTPHVTLPSTRYNRVNIKLSLGDNRAHCRNSQRSACASLFHTREITVGNLYTFLSSRARCTHAFSSKRHGFSLTHSAPNSSSPENEPNFEPEYVNLVLGQSPEVSMASLIGDDVTRSKPLILTKIASETADRVTRARTREGSARERGCQRQRPVSHARRD